MTERVCRNTWFLEQDNAVKVLEVWQELVNLMAELCDTPAGFIVQMMSEGYQVVIANESVENPYSAGGIIPTDVNIFCKKVVTENTQLYVGNATELTEWQSNPEVSEDGFNSYLGFPLHWPDGSPFGTICVMDYAKTRYDDKYFRLLKHFKKMAERELNLLFQTLQLEQLSFHDELTGVFNRRGLSSLVDGRVKLAQRSSDDLLICYFDLDGLKLVNDEYGHDYGDEVIKAFAVSIEAATRENDLVARLGGDEFVALIFLKDNQWLEHIVDRIDQQIAKTPYAKDISYSMGVKKESAEKLKTFDFDRAICAADKAMYKQKQAKLAAK